MEGYGPASYGDGFAEVYDDWYPSGAEADRAVHALAALARRAGGGPVLELGCGTGRLCLPLAARGFDVVGVDASAAMLGRLRAKPGAAQVTAVEGDMAELALGDHPPFGLVFVAFNTFFNLADPDAQQRCLLSVGRHLRGDGRLAVECFVPRDPPPPPEERDTIELWALEADRVVLRVSRLDPGRQTVSGQHVELSGALGVRLRPWHLRYAGPAELDAMAGRAGLALDERWADWTGAPFGDEATHHVSIYRPAPERP